jgi:indole-3-glycerol phosphate synthase
MIDSEVRNLVDHAKERTLQILTEVTTEHEVLTSITQHLLICFT